MSSGGKNPWHSQHCAWPVRRVGQPLLDCRHAALASQLHQARALRESRADGLGQRIGVRKLRRVRADRIAQLLYQAINAAHGPGVFRREWLLARE